MPGSGQGSLRRVEEDGSRWNVHGLIRVDLGPVWTCVGFALEWFFRNLRGL